MSLHVLSIMNLVKISEKCCVSTTCVHRKDHILLPTAVYFTWRLPYAIADTSN